MKHKRHIQWAVLILLALAPMTSVMSQEKEFTLEDLNYGGTNYRNMIPRNLYTEWWGDRMVRQDLDHCSLIDAASGAEGEPLFTVTDVNRWAGLSDSTLVRHLYYAEFPYPDSTLVLLNNGYERMLIDWQSKRCVWRQSTRIDGHAESDEDWNAQSRAVAFVSGDNLYVTDGEGHLRQLTTDGSRELVYGKSVHRNEWGIDKGTYWSPDGQRLAFYRMDQSMVTDYPQVDIYHRIATHQPNKYPMAGETSHKVTVGVYDLQTGKTIYLDAGDPTDRYFTNIAWSPDGSTIYMQELNRAQNDCRLVSYDAVTGARRSEIYRETSEKYVEPLHPIVFLPWDATKFILQSQRDGWNHLYLMDTRGKILKQLTKGEWVVQELLGFNPTSKSVVILSNERDPRQSNHYEVFVSNANRYPLDNGIGCHHGTLSRGGKYLRDVYSAPDVPRCVNLIAVDKHPVSKNLLTAPNPWKGYAVPEYSSGTVKAADGVTDLYYRMVKPTHFDPSKRYPAVVYVYGGPHAHNVDASWHWGSRSWETYMAQKGYVVFVLDNRGSENRGLAFEQATWHQLGTVETKDQMCGVKYLLSLPFVDSSRIGVHGWSFGGFMTITMMVRHPEVFKVGVAGGPVIDWKWYEVMYGERYMGTPQSNPEGYAQSSLLKDAGKLKGRLQIITGYNDETVVPQHCLSFLDACIDAGSQPDFFVYPGEQHNMRGHSSVHLHERITRYFEDYLK